uniref:Putative deoxyribonuclease i n=1 Tax=Corethrella appendiculata TaxID=1370023 RepID=U5EQD9_9DIPT
MQVKCAIFLLIFINFAIIVIARKISPTKSSKISSNSNCEINLNTEISENEPVYVMDNSIAEPNADKIIVKSKLKLVCLGKGNSLFQINQQSIELSCDLGKFKSPNSKFSGFRATNCTKEIRADLKPTSKLCSKGLATIFEIGFFIDASFSKLFEVCFDQQQASVVWTRSYINGKSIKYNIKESKRPTFRQEGIQHKKVDAFYKKASQIKTFTDYLHSGDYFSERSFFARGHLTPDADFIFRYEQFATYFYMNVAPQFQEVNAGNWLSVEILARKLAEKYQTKLLTFNGVHGLLSLKEKTVYLDVVNRKIPAPEWFWKIIIDENAKAGIVMISSNNPFGKNLKSSQFCPNVCLKAGYDPLKYKKLENVEKGYTFCCTIGDFTKIVNNLPDEVKSITNLLKINV